MNRIDKKNAVLKNINKKALVAYITAGFPDLKTTEKIVEVLEKNGVDFIELGMPFSDQIPILFSNRTSPGRPQHTQFQLHH